MYSIFKLKPSYQFPKETLVCSESVNRQDTYSVQFSNKKFFKSTRPRCNDFLEYDVSSVSRSRDQSNMRDNHPIVGLLPTSEWYSTIHVIQIKNGLRKCK